MHPTCVERRKHPPFVQPRSPQTVIFGGLFIKPHASILSTIAHAKLSMMRKGEMV